VIDHPTENTEKSDPFAVLEAAARRLEQAGDQLPAGAMHAVAALAAHEVLRCLDPRHHTTRRQAVDAVFSTSPFAEILTWTTDVESRLRPGAGERL
jgi:hypothetical protein